MNSATEPTKLEARIQASGPKKILTCDGGGIRGLISVEILARIEADLRAQLERPDLVLADYFDFIGGTSTGAIIASCLATGMDVASLRSFYLDSGKLMFEKAALMGRLRGKYVDEPLARLLRSVLNQKLGYGVDAPPALLGDPNLRTLLMLMLRNHTTDSPWPVSNNPFAKYNQRNRPDCNLNLPLWQLVRASTAAPTFFPAEEVVFASDTDHPYRFIFVDGGMTTYNNPAYLAFQMATAQPYGVNWSTGVGNLLVVSVGTGNAPSAQAGIKPEDLYLWNQALSVPSALMNAATAGWDMVCRVLGECRHGGQIDREFGTMELKPGASATSSNWKGTKQFAYVRYDPLTSQDGLDTLGLNEVSSQAMQLMDAVEFIDDLQKVGQAYADQHVKPEHFTGFL